MYSYEERIRAVELFIKLGMRVRPTIRQLGYPTKNSLKGWYREYQQRKDLPKETLQSPWLPIHKFELELRARSRT